MAVVALAVKVEKGGRGEEDGDSGGRRQILVVIWIKKTLGI